MKPSSAMIAMRLQWDDEREELFRQQEEIIKTGKGAFERVAKALSTIKAEGLYLKTHRNFKEYCEERWGFTRQWAYKLLDAVAVKKELLKLEEKAEKEEKAALKKMMDAGPGTLVEMKGLNHEEIKEVAQKVSDVEVTATVVREAVNEVKPRMQFDSAMAEHPILAAMAIEWSLIQATMSYVQITPRNVYEKLREAVKQQLEK